MKYSFSATLIETRVLVKLACSEACGWNHFYISEQVIVEGLHNDMHSPIHCSCFFILLPKQSVPQCLCHDERYRVNCKHFLFERVTGRSLRIQRVLLVKRVFGQAVLQRSLCLESFFIFPSKLLSRVFITTCTHPFIFS